MSQLVFKNKKMEENFIKDMACLRFCIAMTCLSLEGDSYGGDIKIPDLATNNRDIKKTQEYNNDLKNIADDIGDRLSYQLNQSIMNLSSSFFPTMVKILGKHTDVSMVHVCGFMIEKMYNRTDVYFKLQKVGKVWGIKRIIKVFEKHGIKSTDIEKRLGYSLAGALKSAKVVG